MKPDYKQLLSEFLKEGNLPSYFEPSRNLELFASWLQKQEEPKPEKCEHEWKIGKMNCLICLAIPEHHTICNPQEKTQINPLRVNTYNRLCSKQLQDLADKVNEIVKHLNK